MTMAANLHRADRACATKSNGAEWLTFKDKDGNSMTIFMPIAKAEAIAAVFNAPEYAYMHDADFRGVDLSGVDVRFDGDELAVIAKGKGGAA